MTRREWKTREGWESGGVTRPRWISDVSAAAPRCPARKARTWEPIDLRAAQPSSGLLHLLELLDDHVVATVIGRDLALPQERRRQFLGDLHQRAGFSRIT